MPIYKKNGSPVYVEFAGNRYPLRKSRYTLGLSPLHMSDDMTGKMHGIPCISTDCRCNSNCKKRKALNLPGHICPYCFAEKLRANVRAAIASNYRLLTSGLLPDEWLPVFENVAIVRIEAFGDLENVTQARNYLRIIRKNPRVTFAWWTKNAGILDRAIKIEGRPANVVFIQSSEFMDKPARPFFSWVDHVFTVYTSEKKAREKGHRITCGARHCATCRRCYTRRGALHVSELLK